MESPERPLQTQRFDRFEHHLGVGRASPVDAEALSFQVGPNLRSVVDLPIVGDAVTARLRPHRLPSCIAEIDDGKPSVPETDTRLAVEEAARGIWAAMHERSRHPVNPFPGSAFCDRISAPQSCYPAHVGSWAPERLRRGLKIAATEGGAIPTQCEGFESVPSMVYAPPSQSGT